MDKNKNGAAFNIAVLLLLAAGTASSRITILDGINSPRMQPFELTINQPSGSILVSLTASNISDTVKDYVLITCELVITQSGFTAATFSSTSVNHTSTATVPYRLLRPGRENVLQCSAVSLNNGRQFPQNTTTFIGFLVKPAAVLSFCSHSITVPNDCSVNASFTLQFSEQTETNTTVTCIVNRTDVVSQLNVTMRPGVAPVGATTIQVVYDIYGKQHGGVAVTCFAQSALGSHQYASGTSQTASVQFVLDVASIYISPKSTVTRSESFQVLLSLDTVPIAPIQFLCAAHVNTSADETAVLLSNLPCGTPTLTLATTVSTATSTTITASVNSNSTTLAATDQSAVSPAWLISGQSSIALTFDSNNYMLLFDVTRTVAPMDAVTELVIVTCCASPKNDSNPVYLSRYAGLSAVMTAVADLSPPPSVNSSSGTIAANLSAETAIKNPAYVDVAPCPCDLDVNACNSGCCCDHDCSASDVSLFTCETGYWGGSGLLPSQHTCNFSTHAPDWAAFLCVEREHNAYLGVFFGAKPGVRINSDYSVAKSGAATGYSYRSLPTSAETDSHAGGYIDGDVVLTTGRSTVLSLPQRTLDGRCLQTAPVRYLVNSQSTCVHSMTQELCGEGSALSASSYVSYPSAGLMLPCTVQAVYVVQRGGDTATSTGKAPVTASYACAMDAAMYAAGARTSIPAASQNASYLQNELLTYRTLSQGGDGTVACSWDNGYTVPPAPTYDPAAGVCRNAVVGVHYNITWSGVEVLSLDARIVFGNVTINTTSSAYRQNGSSGSSQLPTRVAATYSVVYYQNESTPASRSGNPGYEFGSPLIAGKMAAIIIDEATNYSYMLSTEAPSLISPDASTLCQNAFKTPVSFRVNTVSQCAIMVSTADMDDCDVLRNSIYSKLMNMINVEYLSLGGVANFNDTSQWVPVLRDPYQVYDATYAASLATTTVSASNITTPSRASTTTVSSFDEEVPIDYVSPEIIPEKTKGICFNVSSSVHLTVMYAEAGRSGNVPIYQVVGAKLSYGNATWKVSCTAANCLHNSSHPFLVSTSVAFLQVPSQPQAYLTRYQLRTSINCSNCPSTWSDLLYPISHDSPAKTRPYSLASFLWLVLFVIGIFALTRPWWSCL